MPNLTERQRVLAGERLAPRSRAPTVGPVLRVTTEGEFEMARSRTVATEERVAGLYLAVMFLTRTVAERDAQFAESLIALIEGALNKMPPDDRASYYGQVLVEMRIAAALDAEDP
jgi:hypothetical protein